MLLKLISLVSLSFLMWLPATLKSPLWLALCFRGTALALTKVFVFERLGSGSES